MKLHIFRLSGHDFVHYRKIEIGANDRAVYQQSISCFIVYANFDWFLINFGNFSRSSNVLICFKLFSKISKYRSSFAWDFKTLPDFIFNTSSVLDSMYSSSNFMFFFSFFHVLSLYSQKNSHIQRKIHQRQA